MRTFTSQTYDTNGATPSQNALNHMNAQKQAQNNLSKSGGDSVTVPQYAQTGPAISPQNPNASIVKMAGAQLTADNNASYHHCTGQSASACSANGGSRKKRKSRRKKRRRTIYGGRT